MLLKLLWARKLTWNAHLNGTLHEAQAGSRPGKRAIDLVVYKEQKYLYSRLTRTPLLTMDNDAKACYDRIICNLAMLISQYFGMPQNACSMQAKTLENMEFHLKTALGVSEEFYKHSPTTPVHGSGQGSCASPTLWLIISTILMRCLDRGNPGMAMVQIQQNAKILRSSIDGFVDDTSLFSNIPFQYSNMTDAVRNLQVATQTWAKLLEASGGKLELSKCFYYVLSWKYTNEGEPIPMTIQEQAQLLYPPITIHDPETANAIHIQQKECQSYHKTLGVYKNIVGDDTYQFKELLKKSNNMAQIANGARMSKHHARVAFQMIYLPTIQYCFPACSFTLLQMETIQAKALEKFLPAMGWRRTSSRALVHGPIELGGYNIPHLFALQGTQKLCTLINHIRAKTEIGQLFIANINWIQLLSGRGVHFLHDNFKIEYIHDNWTLHVQSYMHECNISLKSDKFWTPKLARKNDIFLMEAALKINCGVKDLHIINYWRLYFKAFRLSDLCDGYGKQILMPYRKYTASHQWIDTRQSNLNWPKQAQPNKTSFNIWCKFLKLAFHMQYTGHINIKLEAWTIPVNTSDTRWSLYSCPSDRTVYKTTMTFYEIYKQQSLSRLKGTYNRTILEYDVLLPDGCIPATHIRTDEHLVLFTYYGETQEEPVLPILEIIDTFQGFLSTQPLWAKDLSSNWSSIPRDELVPFLQIGISPLILAVDSTVNRHWGNYAIVIGCSDQIIFENKGRILQTKESVMSIRMQWISILSAVVNIKHLYQYFHIENRIDRGCKIFNKNKKITKILQQYKREGFSIGSYGMPHIDIVLQILEEISNLQQLHVQIEVHYLPQRKPKKEEEIPPPRSFPEILQHATKHKVMKAKRQHYAAHDTQYMYPAGELQIFINQQSIYNNIFVVYRISIMVLLLFY